MRVEIIVTGAIEENCYLLIDEKTNDAVIVDPGDEGKKIIQEIESLKLNPKYIILTHGHFDHVGAVEELCKHFDIEFYISKIDEEYMAMNNNVFGKLPKADKYLKDGDVLSLNDHKIKVLETPGHTKGGLCFVCEDNIFTGDTLFRGSVGRSDFLGGDMEELITSVKTKLLPLGDNMKVYPGHGMSSSIGTEIQINPYL